MSVFPMWPTGAQLPWKTSEQLCRTHLRIVPLGTSLAVQWLRLCTFTAVGLGSVPGQGTKIPHATWCGQKNKIK